MDEVIKTKYDLCKGCNRCVRGCPMEMANITYQNEDGDIKVKINSEKCISCGRCVSVCKHDARYYEDDTERFFSDLANGIPISLIAAPAIRINMPEYKQLFTYFKQRGVKKIYDVSLGADICVWAHIKYIEKSSGAPLITQPCPTIVKYCEIYRHCLLKRLSPVHSPMGCISIYMKKYENITDRIAALSPCIAKSNEFADTGLAQYNVTFVKLYEYIRNNNIELPEKETGFDHAVSGLGSLFPMPGGLKENIEFFSGKKLVVDKAEGHGVYERLDIYAESPEELLPQIFDVLNCREGCNMGTACTSYANVFEINRAMDKNRDAVTKGYGKEHFETVYKLYDSTLDISHFMREYHAIFTPFPLITDEDIDKAFELLGKTDYEKQNVDCGACGSETCYGMARLIALNVNIPINCIVKLMEDTKREHEELLRARELNELQLTKLNLAAKATKIGLWDMGVVKNDPINPSNSFMWSDEFRRMLGFSNENDFPNILRSWSDRLHPDDKNYTLKAFENHITDTTGKTPYDVEYRLLKKNGEYGYFRASGETIRCENGMPIRVAGALMDITETKNILLDTEKQRIEAEAANKAKSAFLSTMSHEIRTPMNAILGITEIQLRNETLSPEVKEALDNIHISGEMLLGIINDILDLSKIEAGKLELIPAKYQLASLICDTALLNIMRIGSKPIEFELQVDENLPTLLLGDELRVKQILNNLLSNAFKYTIEGTVRLSVTMEKCSGSNVIIVFRVSDTGQGMTEEQVSELFNEYTRFNLEANRATEGTGLGMSITRNLIRMMKGDIAIESEPGKGSVFTVRLPQVNIGSDVLGKETVNNLHNFRINNKVRVKDTLLVREPMPYGKVLIVDDVEINIYVARGLLTPYKLEIDSAESGIEAIEKITKGNTYDIIFMDHMMPNMDGMETTQVIRDMGYNRPIVALTANAVTGQAEIFMQNGFDDFISKPIDVRRLNTVLNKLIRDKQPPETIAAARQQAEVKNEHSPKPAQQLAINPRFAAAFVRDAEKSIAALDAINKNGVYDEDDVRAYGVHVHGMKSALAAIGKTELSKIARELEILARHKDTKAMSAQIGMFIDLLRETVEELSLV